MRDDGPRVTIFTLADHVAAPPDNKFYINGAGLERVYVPALPGGLPPTVLLVRLMLPPTMHGKTMTLRIRAVDGQGTSVTQDPIVNMDVAIDPTPPDPLEDHYFALVLQLAGLPVQETGKWHFHLVVQGEDLGNIPLIVEMAHDEADESGD